MTSSTKHVLHPAILLALILLCLALGIFSSFLLLAAPDFATHVSLTFLKSTLVVCGIVLTGALPSASKNLNLSTALTSALFLASILFLLIPSITQVMQADVDRKVATLTQFAPHSHYVPRLRAQSTVGEWSKARSTSIAMNRSPIKGEITFALLLSLQKASESPEWQHSMKRLTRDGVILEEDLHWMMAQLQEEAQYASVKPHQALTLLSALN